MKPDNYIRALITGFIAVSFAQEENKCTNIAWLGNSYSSSNGLVQRVQRMLQQADPAGCFNWYSSVRGGERMGNWDDDRITGVIEQQPHWDYLILQEQSQIPGFYGQALFSNSLEGVERLNKRFREYNEEQGAGVTLQTVFYETWGRKDGDNRNPSYYPDFKTMQERLTDGYGRYLEATIEQGFSAIIAPVGHAFDTVYDDVLLLQEAEGNEVNPGVRDGNFFESLFWRDGHHPSELGSYLAANVIYSTITGNDPRDTAPEDDPKLEYYSSVAAVTVHSYHDNIQFDDLLGGQQTSPTQEPAQPPNEDIDLMVQIAFDRWSEETGWYLTEKSTGESIEEHNPGDFPLLSYGGQTLEWVVTLQTNTVYNFTIVDSFGDGFRSDKFADRGYIVSIMGCCTRTIIKEGGQFSREEVTSFIIK